MTTILFGGSGFLGPIILEEFPDIVSVGRTTPPAHLKNKHIHLPDLEHLHMLDEIEFDKVIVLIGSSNHHVLNPHPTMAIEYNVIPLKKILAYLEGRNIKKCIAFTTMLLYDVTKMRLPVDETQPINPYINNYVLSKYLAEEITKLHAHKVPIINVRISNIYGPTALQRPDIVPTLMWGVLTSDAPEVWSTKPARDFVFAADAAHAVVKLLDTDYTGVVNLGSGEMNSVGRIVEIIERLSGKKIKVLDKPVSGPMEYVQDITLVQRLTGWKPTHTLEEGLTITYNRMREYVKHGAQETHQTS